MSLRELALLREDLAALTLSVARLTERVAALEVRDREGSEFEVVSEGATADRSVASAAGPVSTAGLSTLRVEVAEEVGRFLGRACRGEHRGPSGRHKVNLSSRVYIVLAGFDGRLLPAPKLFSTFAQVRDLCQRGPDSGDSIFVGLPSQAEAALAL